MARTTRWSSRIWQGAFPWSRVVRLSFALACGLCLTAASVHSALAACGDTVLDIGEDCDDGNTYGADGCAANCTNETVRTFVPDSAFGLTFQGTSLYLPVSLSGQIDVRTGGDRGTGVYPFASRVTDVTVDPATIPGLVCVCLKARNFASFGPGNGATGTITCAPATAVGVDYLASRDHNRNDVDPFCLTGYFDGTHPGVCNGFTSYFPSGTGPDGTVLAQLGFEVEIIFDGGTCSFDPSNFSKGPDGIPCNNDDPATNFYGILPLTTGSAQGEILDANNTLGVDIADGSACGASNCAVKGTGAPLDCSDFQSNPTGGLGGLALTGITSAMDTFVGDIVAVLGNIPTRAPTLTRTITMVPTVTPTPRSLCRPTPDSSCVGSVSPGQSKFLIKQSSHGGKVGFDLKKAAATLKSDFGDPTASTDYSLCVYDKIGGSPVLISGVMAPAGSNWSDLGSKGFQYVSKDLAPNGMSKMLLRAGEDGRAGVKARGRGTGLQDPALPLDQSPAIIVQIVNDQGGCWGTTFSAPAIGNSSSSFLDRGD